MKPTLTRTLSLVIAVILVVSISAAGLAEEVLYRTPVAPIDLENAQYGGTFRLGNRFSGVNNIGYPAAWGTNDSWPNMSACPAIESLTRYDENGKLVPWLAKSWDVDGDALTIKVELQPNVTFHDGTPFNAEAVIWNWEQSPLNGRNMLDAVESYEALDDLNILVKLNEWDSSIEDNLLYICSWMISPTATEANGTDWASANPVGTGPFVFEEWVRDVGVYYNKNENYWQEGLPYLDRVEIKIYADVTAIYAALSTGLVDAVMPADATVALSWANEGGITETGTNTQVTQHGIIMPSGNPDLPFSDVRVRQAISYAIDTQAMAELMSEQGGDYVGNGQMALPGSIAWDDELVGYGYDPEKAKELLAEAGYPDGFTCPGYVIVANNLLKQCADIIAAYLADVGINVENQNNDMALIGEMTAGTGKPLDGLVWMVAGLQPNPIAAYANSFLPGGNTYAYITYQSDAMHQAIADAKAAKTPEELEKATKAMVLDNYENVMIIPVALQNNGQCVTERVHNLGYARNSQYEWDPEIVWMDQD